ncbi:MAG: Spy/CpxP family protein refolding chaperone [Deltaproteobacteria bacterium]|nr:Spy/CpxP family protein refolding chaperone [Deltaproteobacteria bacterium]
MKTKMTRAILLAFLMGFVGISIVEAEPLGPHWKAPYTRPGLDRLKAFYGFNLTDAQRTQMNDILTRFRDETADLRGDIQRQHRDFSSLLQSESFNEEEVRAAFRELSGLTEELFILKTKMKNEIKAVLTPEQLKALKEQKTERMERANRRFERGVQ